MMACWTSLKTQLGAREILRVESRNAYLIDNVEISARELSNICGDVTVYRGAQPPMYLQPGPRSCAYCRGSKRDSNDSCWGCGAP